MGGDFAPLVRAAEAPVRRVGIRSADLRGAVASWRTSSGLGTMRPSRHEPDLVVIALERRLDQTGGFEARTERGGVHRDEHVVDVALPDRGDVQCINADEDPTGPKGRGGSPGTAGPGPRVTGGGGASRTRHRREPVGRKPTLAGVGTDDGGIVTGQPLFECSGQVRVDLHHGDRSDMLAKQVGREPGPRADLEHLVAEIADADDPGPQVRLSIWAHSGLERNRR